MAVNDTLGMIMGVLFIFIFTYGLVTVKTKLEKAIFSIFALLFIGFFIFNITMLVLETTR
ncbi:putative secreted/membrane protein [Bacillus phage AR9]|uniref:Uncharacterized protein n=2 Tax=Bacillus phage PBS1 TaxID=10683 RepID=A0A223LDD1_BPPB1|nr:putative secreted/membrane protein [Bacillus phage AR9]YP_009664342.1 hypothetical protein FK780_gp306 [Bacillus phage PBS1]WCS68377.1 hypothetical protein Goe21_02680 [Bacillus phage vB_BsuM-Goe21]AMS01332.1 putative secreted/membrane protein [Bacillus phage AR9]AST99962.1 hypothetical protein PBI_PBS1_141 [Bacillus phage PBS1]BDE75522.1 hypothetical protein [Bacillus phage PBS1]